MLVSWFLLAHTCLTNDTMSYPTINKDYYYYFRKKAPPRTSDRIPNADLTGGAVNVGCGWYTDSGDADSFG